jgi:hypothetical protein
MKDVVVYERGPENWGAFAPDLPGYGATGSHFISMACAAPANPSQSPWQS